jgi:DNA repair photolyase
MPSIKMSAKNRPVPPILPPQGFSSFDYDGSAEAMGDHPAKAVVVADRRRGRGALSNGSGRLEPVSRVIEDDGWDSLSGLEAFKTVVTVEKPKVIITRNQSPDISFDRSINPYRGCEHGCVYCFARPTHAYMGLSAGLDFETRLFAKHGAGALLERELSAPGYQPRMIAIGTNTDPYQPIEREHRVMREVLEVLAKANHPVGIVTKSALVLRDLDLLAPMAAKGLVKVALSVTTLDAQLARRMEPRAATPAKRLDALRQLSEAGVPTMVMVAPIVPALNDAEIEDILDCAQTAGVQEAGYVLLRLPQELRDLFREWLLEHYPGKLRHILSMVQSTRGGKDYDARWGVRQTGEGAYAALIAKRFQLACQRSAINKNRSKLRNDLFVAPVPQGGQLSLF